MEARPGVMRVIRVRDQQGRVFQLRHLPQVEGAAEITNLRTRSG